MDITSTIHTATTAGDKSPEAETQTQYRIQPSKPLTFTNGVLKRHHPLNPPRPPAVVTFGECLRNHAASLGGHALDGCGEFMPSPTASPTDPTSLKCAACGCHRNFHRRDPEEPFPHPQHLIEYQPHNRHQPPPPPPGGHGSPDSHSPPPISSAYYPSAPHMLLALSGGVLGLPPESNPSPGMAATTSRNPRSRKRFRTKFSQEQKERMLEFAERIRWKMQKKDEELISEFCRQVSIDKGVFKVWMHNHKNNSTLGKRDVNNNNNSTGIVISADNRNSNDTTSTHSHQQCWSNTTTTLTNLSLDNHQNTEGLSADVATNGSSSSS